jgi:dTDP-4-dehydrorhamnose reductase
MANILITGSNGQLGRELRDIWSDGAPGIEIKTNANKLFFKDVSELDITDRDAVEKYVSKEKIEIIVNCAAYTAVDKAEDDIKMATAVNTDAAKNLAEASAKLNSGPLLIHVSTDYVFDGKGHKPYREDDVCNPAGVYGRTKYEGEREIQKSGCNYMIIRTSWLYSTYGTNFVKTITRLAGERDSLNVVFDQIGTPTYAGDLAEAIEAIVKKYIGAKSEEQKRLCGIYHFSNEGVCSWYDFAMEIVAQTGSNCKVNPVTSEMFPAKAHRPHYSVLDKSKIKATFGIEIPHWRVPVANKAFWKKLESKK